MTTLNISKVNETYIKVLAEPYIQAELSEFFTCQVPGYRFMPAYRSKRWDGKLRLYSKATGKIYLNTSFKSSSSKKEEDNLLLSRPDESKKAA